MRKLDDEIKRPEKKVNFFQGKQLLETKLLPNCFSHNSVNFLIHTVHSGRANCLMGDGRVISLTKDELKSEPYNFCWGNYMSVYDDGTIYQ